MDAPRQFSHRTWVIAVALLSIGIYAAAQIPPLRLVATAWPPFTNEPGKPRFALDLVEAALGRIGVQANIEIVPAADFTASLLSRRFDGSAAVWKDPERERVLIFSEPYLENRLILVGRRGSDVSATSFAALKGKKIAIVEGYSYGNTIENAGPTFVRTSSEQESLTRLLDGSVDYALMDELVVRYLTSNYPKEAQERLQYGTTPLLSRPLHFAIRRDMPNAQSIVDKFNAQLQTMIKDGTYHQLLHLDWIDADVDGDGVSELVPRDDRIGNIAPKDGYSITASTGTTGKRDSEKEKGPRFFIGGNLYTDWASIPNRYKVEHPRRPDPSRSAASIFTFRW